MAFMQKWHLGNTQKLHKPLTTMRKQAVSTKMRISPNGSPQSPVSAVQFPEEQSNWCGNGTASTILVEDSFVWPGTLNGGVLGGVLTYDPYQVSQSYTTAYNDENMLAIRYIYDTDAATSSTNPNDMESTLNNFVQGSFVITNKNYTAITVYPAVEPNMADVNYIVGTGDAKTGLFVEYPTTNNRLVAWICNMNFTVFDKKLQRPVQISTDMTTHIWPFISSHYLMWREPDPHDNTKQFLAVVDTNALP